MSTGVFFVFMYSCVTLCILRAVKRYGVASPMFFFPVFHSLMAIGTFFVIDDAIESDVVYCIMYTISIISFGAGCAFFSGSSNLKRAFAIYQTQAEDTCSSVSIALTVAIFVVSALITFLYYYVVGYNMMFRVIFGSYSGDYSTDRLAMYSGDTYFFPGYVNQFKNVLLPVSSAAISIWLRRKYGIKVCLLFLISVIPLLLYALLGTGQRFFLVFSFSSLFFGLALLYQRRISAGIVLFVFVLFAVILFLFSIMTISYHGLRSDDLVGIFYSVTERFLRTNQEGALLGFRYVYGMETVWYLEWIEDTLGLLPGITGSLIAHELHAVLYGSFRGTAPLSSVGSAYRNGGTVGVFLVFFIYGVICSYSYYRFLRGKKTVLRALLYGAFFACLSTFFAGSPIALVDNGAVTIMTFLLLSKLRLASHISPNSQSPTRKGPHGFGALRGGG